MKTRLRSLALVSVLLLAFGAIPAACGGGNGGGNGGVALTLEEYFQRFASLDENFSEQSDALEARLDENLMDVIEEEEALDLLRANIDENLDNFEDFIDGIADLNPPDDVKDAHNEAVDAARAFVDAFGEISGDLGDAESFAEMDELFSQEDFTGAEERVTAACVGLEQIAASNGIDIDLDCGEEDDF